MINMAFEVADKCAVDQVFFPCTRLKPAGHSVFFLPRNLNTCDSIKKYFSSGKKSSLFVVDYQDVFWINPATRGLDEIHHADLGKYERAITAGTLSFSEKMGTIKIDNVSGSYMPGTLPAIANAVLRFIAAGLGEYARMNHYSIEVEFHSPGCDPQDVTSWLSQLLSLSSEAALDAYQRGVGAVFSAPSTTPCADLLRFSCSRAGEDVPFCRM